MRQQLKYFYRNLSRRPVQSLISFFCFTVGILAGLLIYFWVLNELNYEKFHPDYNRIYRVLTLSKQKNDIVKSADCYRPIAKTLKDDYPQIENATYISFSSENSPLKREGSNEKIEAKMCWSDNDFFQIFKGFRFIEGSPVQAFQNSSNIVITEEVAQKIFGKQPALGQKLISDKYSKEVYIVGGVVQIPPQSHLDFGFMLSENNSFLAGFSDSWSDKSYVHVYIKLTKDAHIDDQFLSRISNQVGRYSNYTDKLLFQPLTDIHLHSDYEPSSLDRNISSYKYVLIFSALAILIILMASFNYSVLSTARASERTIEIGVKKANGASKYQFLRQFIGESIIQTIAATLLALIIIWFILPVFNNLTGNELHLNFSFQLLLNLLLFTISTGILAGIYPSFYLASLNPVHIFQKGNFNGNGKKFIGLLVIVQFTIAIVFIIATILLIKQLNYVHHKELGYDHENIVVVSTGIWYNNKEFKDELQKNPNIINVSASSYAPVDIIGKISLVFNRQGVTDSLLTSILWVDEDFAKTYNLKMVEGQFLQMDYSTFWKEYEKINNKNAPTFSFPVVINETAKKALRFSDPIGQRIGDFVIIGVVKDFNYRTLHHPIDPILLTYDPQNIGTMNIKISPLKRTETLNYIHDTYIKQRDHRAFSYHFFDDLINEKYKSEILMKNITILFSILAVIISMLGILGISWFSIEKRTKEIGIRKVNGARISEVLIMLNKDFVKWVAIAFVISTPIAWYAMHKWLENFAYKTELSWWIFALAGLLALGIALLTVSWQSWRAATRNPVEALRYE
jgi:putative ABC transport system permease protein